MAATAKASAKAKTKAAPKPGAIETVDDYLATLAPDAQARLSELRRLIHQAVDGLVEGLTYKIPVFRLDGRQVVSIGAAKTHYALYVIRNDAVLERHEAELRAYETGKGVVKFPLDRPLPAALVTKLVRAAAAS